MEYTKVYRKVTESPKGSYHAMSWVRPLKVRAAYKDSVNISKMTIAHSLRFGVNYDNMASTKEARENGTKPAVNAGLVGRSWIVPNLMLKTDKTGKTLLRVSLAKTSKFDTKYYLNGKEVDKKAIEPYVLASEIKPHEPQNVFDISTDSIIMID